MSEKSGPMQYFTRLKKNSSFRLRSKPTLTEAHRSRAATNDMVAPLRTPVKTTLDKNIVRSKRRSRSMSPVMRELKEKLLLRNREATIQENRCKSQDDLTSKINILEISSPTRLRPITGKFKDLPDFIEQSFAFLELEENVTRIGLYRIPGNFSVCEKLWLDVTEKKSLDFTKVDTYNLTTLIKWSIRKLDPPIMKHELFQDILKNLKNLSKVENILYKNRQKFNFCLFQRLVYHLKLVGNYKDKNMMDVQNLAIIWSPCLVSGEFCSDPLNLPVFYGENAQVLVILVENCSKVFKEH